jgi:DNA-binding CsgD family transcriptional regulator/PAS domain-containing protein
MFVTRFTAEADDRLIDRIYDAAFEPGAWLDVLDQLAERVGAHPANIMEIDIASGAGWGIAARAPDGIVDRFFADWADQNVIGIVNDPADYSAKWTPRILLEAEYIDRSALERSPYWNEFLVPIEASHNLAIRLSLRGQNLTSINFGRPGHKGPFDTAAVVALQPFHRHLIRAERLWRRFGPGATPLGDLRALLAVSSDALLVLDDSLHLVDLSSAAEAIFRDGRALTLQQGRLRCANPSEQDRLSAMLKGVLAGLAPPPMEIAGRTGGAAVMLSADRLGDESPLRPAGGRKVLVSIWPKSADLGATLRERFALTGAEIALAKALLAGKSLSTIALERGVSLNTVRNQLAAIFDKTDCRRQQELVRLLVRLEGT